MFNDLVLNSNMKKFRFFALAAIAAICASASAQKVITLDQLQKASKQQQQQTSQATRTQAVKQPRTSSSSSVDGGFSTFYVQYNFETLSYSNKGFSSSETVSALTLGYSKAIGMLDDVPFYLELGGALKYMWDSDEGVKTTFLSLKIPVDVVYSYKITDNISLDPYAGLYARLNLIGKEKFEDESVNLFSKDDMGDDTWNRFQLGLQGGVRVRFNEQFAVGVGYTQDLTNVADHMKFHSIDLTLGLNF